jgi:hypothetical protein
MKLFLRIKISNKIFGIYEFGLYPEEYPTPKTGILSSFISNGTLKTPEIHQPSGDWNM